MLSWNEISRPGLINKINKKEVHSKKWPGLVFIGIDGNGRRCVLFRINNPLYIIPGNEKVFEDRTSKGVNIEIKTDENNESYLIIVYLFYDHFELFDYFIKSILESNDIDLSICNRKLNEWRNVFDRFSSN